MMSSSSIALHVQRRFLMVAFHPYGSDVCSLLGMPEPSLDVDEVERLSAVTPWRDLLGCGVNQSYLSHLNSSEVISFAHLYEMAAASLINASHPQYNRSLGEDLISFFIAVVALGEDQQ